MPQSLIKAFSCKSHVESFLKGCIILRSISYYRSEFPPVGDKHESTIDYDGGRGCWAVPTVILCFHDPAIQCSRYGCFFVKIHDADVLLASIKEKICSFLKGSVCPKIGSVKYYDVLDHYPCHGQDIMFYKKNHWAVDKEWRMVFHMKCPKHFEDTETIKFKLVLLI